MRPFVLLILLCLTCSGTTGKSSGAPSVLLINGEPWHVYQVKQITVSADFVGYTYCSNETIEILRSMSDREKAETLIHEAMHAMSRGPSGECDDSLWNNPRPEEINHPHPGIYWGSARMTDFIADNPQLMLYIAKAYGKEKEWRSSLM